MNAQGFLVIRGLGYDVCKQRFPDATISVFRHKGDINQAYFIFPVVDIQTTGRFIVKPQWARIFDLMAIVFMGLLPGFYLQRLNAGI